jgi:3-oxoacyl-[acyl-carrier protein] reductase
MSLDDLSEKVVLVAGGAGGIGSASCRLLASHGATVVGVRRKGNAQQASSVSEMSSDSVVWVEADLRFPAEWQEVVQRTYAKFHRIDVFVNCVGTLVPGKVDSLTDNEVENVVASNFLSVVYGAREVLSIMKRQMYGHIITLGSLGGIIPMPFEALYSATKFAVRGFCLSLDEELMGTGICSSIIEPGPVRTAMLDRAALYDGSTRTFVYKPLETVEVARAIVNVIHHPKKEVILPKSAAVPSLVLSHFPTLLAAMQWLLHVIGETRLRVYRQRYLSKQLVLQPEG